MLFHHRLLGPSFLNVISLVSFSLGGILILLKGGDLQLLLLLRFGDVRITHQLGLLPGFFGQGLLDPRIPLGFRLSDISVPLDRSDPRFTERL
ncbi:hypothetical protein D3C81_1333250 [compost metagenome]